MGELAGRVWCRCGHRRGSHGPTGGIHCRVEGCACEAWAPRGEVLEARITQLERELSDARSALQDSWERDVQPHDDPFNPREELADVDTEIARRVDAVLKLREEENRDRP